MQQLKEEFFKNISFGDKFYKFFQNEVIFASLFWNLEDLNEFWIDEKFFTLLGYPNSDDTKNKEVWNLAINPLDRERLLVSLKQLFNSKQDTLNIELKFRNVNGKLFYLHLKGWRIKTEKSKPNRIIGFLFDHSFAKNREQMLLRCNHEANIGFWEVNMIDNTVFWSQVTKEIHEVAPDYIPNMEEGINFFDEGWSRARISELVERAISKGESYETELILVTKMGRKCWVKSIGVPEIHEGKCLRIFGTFQNIDERKKSQLLLEQNERKFKGIFNSSFSLIGLLNKEGILLEINQTALDLAEINVESVIGNYFWDCYWWKISKESQQELRSNFKLALQGEERRYEVDIWIANEVAMSVLFSLKPILDESGEVLSIVTEGRPIQELIDSKRKLESILEATDVGTWEWNISSDKLTINERWAEILEYSLEELEPISVSHWGQLIHPEDQVRSLRLLNDCFEKKTENYEAEIRMKKKDGSWVWVLEKGKVFSWSFEGNPLTMFGTHQDISVKKAKENQMVAFIKESALAIAMFDRFMRFISISEKWLIEYGLDYSIIGKSIYDVFTDTSDERRKIHKASLSGETIVCEEEQVTRQNGSKPWVRWEMKPWHDEENKIGGVMIFVENITKKKENEELLKISEESFRNSFNYSSIGMALVGQDGKWLKVNDALCNIIGYSKEELKLLTFQDITHPEDLEKDLSLLQEVIDGYRDAYEMEKRYFHKTGRVVYIKLAVSAVRNLKNEILYFVSQIVDVTSIITSSEKLEKANQELEFKNNELEQFAFIAAHDLKEPLRSISGLLSLVEAKYGHSLHDKGRYYIDLAIQSSKRMSELIEGILNYSRTGISKKTKIDLQELVENIFQGYASIEEYSGAIFELGDLPVIKADPIAIKQVFSNLIGNGLKYQPKNNIPHIKVTFEDKNDHWLFSVSDNGIGIDPNHYDKVFTLFKRLHSKNEYSGSGIGLATCQKIIKQYNGEISIEPNLPTGSVINFSLSKESVT